MSPIGQEAFDVEDRVQEKNKRTLSLVLALIMICSTMGVMAFAQERADLIECECFICVPDCRLAELMFVRMERSFNRVIACPLHNELHDAEEYYVGEILRCTKCKHNTFALSYTEYECIL